MPFVSLLKLSMANNGIHRLVPVIKSNGKKSIQFLIKGAQWLELLSNEFSLPVHLTSKHFQAVQKLTHKHMEVLAKRNKKRRGNEENSGKVFSIWLVVLGKG